MASGEYYLTPKLDDTSRPDIMAAIGPADSNQPVREASSKADVLAALGPPIRRSLDGKAMVYGARYLKGREVGLLDYGVRSAVPKYRWYTIRIDFGDDQKVRGIKIYSVDRKPAEIVGIDIGALGMLLPEEGSETLDPEIEAYLVQRDWRRAELKTLDGR